MAYAIVVPRLGWSMEEGTFVRWLKRDGDTVRRGEALFELEGEKALQEIEAVDDGILRIPPDAPQDGNIVSVGQILGYLVAEGEPLPPQSVMAAQELSAPGDAVQLQVEVKSAGESSAGDYATISPATAKPRLVITPRARHIAKELGVDWTRLAGSGAGGRIRERDVRAVADSCTRRGTRLPISKRRRAIAERLVFSHQQTVPVTLTIRADATNLVNVRAQFQPIGGEAVIPSYQDLERF